MTSEPAPPLRTSAVRRRGARRAYRHPLSPALRCDDEAQVAPGHGGHVAIKGDLADESRRDRLTLGEGAGVGFEAASRLVALGPTVYLAAQPREGPRPLASQTDRSVLG